MTFDHFGETFITYNPDFQELIINEAYTIRKDGSKVETPRNAFNPMLPEGCTKCERLNGIRTMVVTHTALEYDAVIVLDYTIRSKNFSNGSVIGRSLVSSPSYSGSQHQFPAAAFAQTSLPVASRPSLSNGLSPTISLISVTL